MDLLMKIQFMKFNLALNESERESMFEGFVVENWNDSHKKIVSSLNFDIHNLHKSWHEQPH